MINKRIYDINGCNQDLRFHWLLNGNIKYAKLNKISVVILDKYKAILDNDFEYKFRRLKCQKKII